MDSWISHNAVVDRKKNCGAGLTKIHQNVADVLLQGGAGLWCTNHPEGQIVDLGCMAQSLFTISIHETLGIEATGNIINQAALTVVCASAGYLECIHASLRAVPPSNLSLLWMVLYHSKKQTPICPIHL